MVNTLCDIGTDIYRAVEAVHEDIKKAIIKSKIYVEKWNKGHPYLAFTLPEYRLLPEESYKFFEKTLNKKTVTEFIQSKGCTTMVEVLTHFVKFENDLQKKPIPTGPADHDYPYACSDAVAQARYDRLNFIKSSLETYWEVNI